MWVRGLVGDRVGHCEGRVDLWRIERVEPIAEAGAEPGAYVVDADDTLAAEQDLPVVLVGTGCAAGAAG